jgi:hypothetical protein
VVSAAGPPRSLISVSRPESPLFLSSSSSFMPTRAEWTPFQTHCYSENFVAPAIEPRASVLEARNSDHETTETVLRFPSLREKAVQIPVRYLV